jgi:hypothetical protein
MIVVQVIFDSFPTTVEINIFFMATAKNIPYFLCQNYDNIWLPKITLKPLKIDYFGGKCIFCSFWTPKVSWFLVLNTLRICSCHLQILVSRESKKKFNKNIMILQGWVSRDSLPLSFGRSCPSLYPLHPHSILNSYASRASHIAI